MFDVNNLTKNIKKNFSNKYTADIKASSLNRNNNYKDIITINNENYSTFISDLKQLFTDELLTQDLEIDGTLKCSSIEVDEILIKSINNQSDLSSINFNNLDNSSLNSIKISSSEINNTQLNSSTINNSSYYQSSEISFNQNIVPFKNDSGWIGCSYLRNLRTIYNETDSNFFILDILGETNIKTTNGNININTINTNNENNDILVNSSGNILFNSKNLFDIRINNESIIKIQNNMINIDRGIKGLKYNDIILNYSSSNDEIEYNLLSSDSYSIISLNLINKSYKFNLPSCLPGTNFKLMIRDDLSNNNKIDIITYNNTKNIFGIIYYSDNKTESIKNVYRIIFENNLENNLNGSCVELYTDGYNWILKIYCMEASIKNIIKIFN